MAGVTTDLKMGRPSLGRDEETVKFSLSMTKGMREGIDRAVEDSRPSKGDGYNASSFVREAIGEKMERMGSE